MSPLYFVLAALMASTFAHAVFTSADHELRGLSRQGQRNINPIKQALNTSLPKSKLPQGVDRRQDLPEPQGCAVNISFALQSSRSITDEEFYKQVNLVTILGATLPAILQSPVRLAAARYDRRASRIARLSSDLDYFADRVGALRPVLQRRVLQRAGIRYCARTLRGRRGDANVFILLGNGRRTDWRAVWYARRFRGLRGLVNAVGVGIASRRALLRITGCRKRLFAVDDVSGLID